jgi:cell division initiation protein
LELRKKEAALNNTLVAAQQVVEEMRRNAQKEVDLRIKEAELQAERLTQEAWEQLRRIKQEISDARREKTLFLERWRSAVKTMERTLVLAAEGEATSGDAKSAEASRASAEQINLTSST